MNCIGVYELCIRHHALGQRKMGIVGASFGGGAGLVRVTLGIEEAGFSCWCLYVDGKRLCHLSLKCCLFVQSSLTMCDRR
jgi:hypothetical protein